MKLDKAYRRDKKHNKRKNGMRTSGKSVFLIQEQLIKRASKEGAVKEIETVLEIEARRRAQ